LTGHHLQKTALVLRDERLEGNKVLKKAMCVYRFILFEGQLDLGLPNVSVSESRKNRKKCERCRAKGVCCFLEGGRRTLNFNPQVAGNSRRKPSVVVTGANRNGCASEFCCDIRNNNLFVFPQRDSCACPCDDYEFWITLEPYHC
jgi:hypothetical protein